MTLRSEVAPVREPLLLDLPEAARRLGGLSTRTVRRLIERGELHGHRIGRRLLVSVSSIHELIDRALLPAHNFERVGRNVPENSTCRDVDKTAMGSMNGRTPRTTGRRMSTPAAHELGALLEFKNPRKDARKPKP